ncbi:MAG: hypothetical protein HIU88_01750 [Acidobacteria bacterium]|nr:hypothetical protein [Acidobacteriota bacterium]
MSCIRFNTPAQRAQMAAAAPTMLTSEEAARLHPAPPVTASKIQRLRLLAENSNPKIRESVASSYHAPAELFERLAHDVDAGVRGCVARNEAVPCEVLRELAHDTDATVRGWVAVNFFVPDDVMHELADDPDATVRSLVAWKSSLAAAATV